MLAADLAVQLAVAELLVEFDDYCFFMVAEEAGEGGCEGFALVEETWVSFCVGMMGNRSWGVVL